MTQHVVALRSRWRTGSPSAWARAADAVRLVALVSVVVGIWLYVANRSAPDDSAAHEKRRREVAERAAAAKARGGREEGGRRRPSMSA